MGESVYYEFMNLSTAKAERHALWLYPEPNGSAIVDECGDNPLDQARGYLRALEAGSYADDLDAVVIYWSVVVGDPIDGGCRGIEAAPFQRDNPLKNFLDYYSWPVELTSRKALNWYTMEVRQDRFESFWTAMGWIPSPLQHKCAMAAILRAHLNTTVCPEGKCIT